MTNNQTNIIAMAVFMVAASLAGCGSDSPRMGVADGGPRVDGAAMDGGGTDGSVIVPDGMVLGGTICEDTCSSASDGECDDGAPGSITSICAFGSDCADCGVRNRSECMPDCAGATCGDDGCGGVCGTCTEPASCQGGTCEVCTPDCGGATCGDDGCGGTCGTCATGMDCECGVCGGCGAGTMCSFGSCRTPDCAGRVCGSDGAGGRCGTMTGDCAMGMGCTDGMCLSCDCTGRTCGMRTGCAESCGDCAGTELCDRITGTCSATATPAACNNTCRFSGDNECDDGRPGSQTSLCDPGSDCADCGPM